MERGRGNRKGKGEQKGASRERGPDGIIVYKPRHFRITRSFDRQNRIAIESAFIPYHEDARCLFTTQHLSTLETKEVM